VNEDVRGTWSAALAMDPSQGDVQWRLVTPTGGVSWAHTGTIEPPELARVFDNYLFPSPPPSPRTLVTRVVPGTRLDTSVLGAGLYYDVARLEAEERCPPPLGPYSYDARAVFVQADSRSSRAAIERLAREYSAHEGDRPFVALIVDGASPEDLDRLKERLPEEFVAIPDPRGAIASQFGVRAWPTSVTVNEGIVTAVDVGAEPDGRRSDSESAS
jgi:hypothetical protein